MKRTLLLLLALLDVTGFLICLIFNSLFLLELQLLLLHLLIFLQLQNYIFVLMDGIQILLHF